jgi:hypothetical protein
LCTIVAGLRPGIPAFSQECEKKHPADVLIR